MNPMNPVHARLLTAVPLLVALVGSVVVVTLPVAAPEPVRVETRALVGIGVDAPTRQR